MFLRSICFAILSQGLLRRNSLDCHLFIPLSAQKNTYARNTEKYQVSKSAVETTSKHNNMVLWNLVDNTKNLKGKLSAYQYFAIQLNVRCQIT